MKTFSDRDRAAATHARRPAAQPETERSPGAAGTPHARDAVQRERIDSAFGSTAQRVGAEEEELQMKSATAVQRQGEEDELLQGRFDPAQRQPEEEEMLQGRTEPGAALGSPTAASDSRGGMPDGLRSGIEALSGMDMSDVQVHAGSSKPAELNALAYTQGNHIHVAPGQEQHLPHEAWHVVQQRQGRVQPTMQIGEVNVNDDAGLEAEADAMGARALGTKAPERA